MLHSTSMWVLGLLKKLPKLTAAAQKLKLSEIDFFLLKPMASSEESCTIICSYIHAISQQQIQLLSLKLVYSMMKDDKHY